MKLAGLTILMVIFGEWVETNMEMRVAGDHVLFLLRLLISVCELVISQFILNALISEKISNQSKDLSDWCFISNHSDP